MVTCGAQGLGDLYFKVLRLTRLVVQGGRKTLVLREVTEESVSKLLEKKDALASCDVLAFVYDRCDFETASFFPFPSGSVDQ